MFVFILQALSAVLLVYNRKYGLCTSGLQFLFWFLMALCGAIQFRTEVRGSREEIPESYYSYISYLIYYPFILIMLFLNCFADRAPRHSEYPKLQVCILVPSKVFNNLRI
jgi:ATP-binding cassette subfamily C (CFTR/MRP) protein 1